MQIPKKTICFLLALIVIFLLTAPAILNAKTNLIAQSDALKKLQNVGEKAYGTKSGAPPSPGTIIGTLINAFLGLVGVGALFLVVYGGYLWMSARGNEERITKAKETLEAAVIGLIITLAAYGISYFVVRRVMEATVAP